jgi:hypothetical protein
MNIPVFHVFHPCVIQFGPQGNQSEVIEEQYGDLEFLGDQEAPFEVQQPQGYFGQKVQYLREKCQETVNKILKFLEQNKKNLFFGLCCLTTALLAPHLFFPTAAVTIILRIEITCQLNQLATTFLKDEVNPFKGPRTNGYVSSLDATMGAIAALDAIALATLFPATSLSIIILPAIAGIAAGNVAARLAMDLAEKTFFLP